MEWNDFCIKIDSMGRFFRDKLHFEYNDEQINYKISEQDYVYTKNDFNTLKNNAEHFSFQPFSILNNYQYESLVDFPDGESRRRLSMNFEERIFNLVIADEENNLSYSFKESSQELLYYVLSSYDNRHLMPRIPSSMLERRCDALDDKSIFNILRLIIRLPFSVCVASHTPINQDKLIKYAKSYLFNFAFNLDLVLKPITEIDDLFPKRNSRSMRRIQNLDELMPPQLTYMSELTEQYYMALASSDPFVKFIGFYHIMEYLYEDVYNEDIFESVKHILQHPGFSSKRKKDVAKIIDIIKKKTRQSKEEFQGSELEALELTIKKFVNIAELNNNLTEYDSDIIEYYNHHQVNFSSGDTIDLHDISNEKLPKKIAARIYKTRNSLVHSKSNDGRILERGIYKPFKDKDELSKEIPLMRLIAETIIINSATSL